MDHFYVYGLRPIPFARTVNLGRTEKGDIKIGDDGEPEFTKFGIVKWSAIALRNGCVPGLLKASTLDFEDWDDNKDLN